MGLPPKRPYNLSVIDHKACDSGVNPNIQRIKMLYCLDDGVVNFGSPTVLKSQDNQNLRNIKRSTYHIMREIVCTDSEH